MVLYFIIRTVAKQTSETKHNGVSCDISLNYCQSKVGSSLIQLILAALPGNSLVSPSLHQCSVSRVFKAKAKRIRDKF
jgi:hypothetical protein